LTVENVLVANQVLNGGDGADTLNLGSTSNNTVTVSAFETVNGNTGIDTISASGSSVATTISGGGGNDILTGGTAGDTLLGQAGADTLAGGQGIDTLTGGTEADLFAFQGGTGTAGTFARAQSLGTDIITDFLSGTDLFALSNGDFSFGSSGTLSATASSLTYVETATALTGTGADTNGGDSSTGAALVIVGAASGTAGVEVWFTTAQENADTNNSYQIATVNGVNTTNVANTDFTLIA
jgi:Ca2+-binding RTX toxin-like protein